ncbi:RNA polymerase sigma factor [Oceanobacillus sp. CAU 1775]
MDEEVISDWFDAYADDVYRFLVYYTGSIDVEDLVQEVFLKAVNRYDSYQGEASPKTWLISIARNLAIDEARKRKRKDWRKLIKHTQQSIEPNPEDLQISSEEKLLLHQSIAKLKQNYQDVIVLRGIEELSVNETAKVLNWTDTKVRVTFHRALKVLQTIVKEDFHEPE